MIKEWWKEAVVYQIYPRSFKDSNGDGIGDIRGIIEKLDYVKNLGVDVIWLNPVYDSPNDDNGYDISNYQSIHPDFGSMADWEELLEKMHSIGLKLIMDLVVNHSSDEHQWFKNAISSKDNPYRDYYHWVKTADGQEPNSNKSFFSGTIWEKDEKSDEYYLHLFTKKQPDLNWENPKLRQEIYTMMKWWLDKGIDGFRMDVISCISKTPATKKIDREPSQITYDDYANGPLVHEYLKEMNREVLSKYDIMTVGECPGTNTVNALDYVGADRGELQMIFSFDHMAVDSVQGYGKWSFGNNKMYKLKKILSKWQKSMEGKGWNSIYLMNHDQPRALSRFGCDLPDFRELSGEMLATMTLTQQGTPYIYMGEEIGMTNNLFEDISDYKDVETLNYYKEQLSYGRSHNEIMNEIKHKSRDNARTPFHWNKSVGGGFTTGIPWIRLGDNFRDINAENAIKNKDSIFYYYKELISLRKNNLALIYGEFINLDEENKIIFIYKRVLGKDEFLIILNMGIKEQIYNLKGIDLINYNQVLSNYKNILKKDEDSIVLGPFEARIFKYNQ